ncbi:MAG TPA: hypothetical protein VEA63_11445 [Opitutus sp.]|nr:hypothetical protein [Opitutus sp.]
MNAPTTKVAQARLDAADKTASFPEIVGKLLEAGFEGYLVDRRRNTTTYYLADGDKSCLKTVRRWSRSRALNQPAVSAQIRGRKPIRLNTQSSARTSTPMAAGDILSLFQESACSTSPR